MTSPKTTVLPSVSHPKEYARKKVSAAALAGLAGFLSLTAIEIFRPQRAAAGSLQNMASAGEIIIPANPEAGIPASFIKPFYNRQAREKMRAAAADAISQPAETIPYGGGWVMENATVCSILWQVPGSAAFPPEYKGIIQNFLQHYSGSSALMPIEQYADSGGNVSANFAVGDIILDASAPASGATGTASSPISVSDVNQEITNVLGAMTSPACQAPSRNTEYMVFLSSGVRYRLDNGDSFPEDICQAVGAIDLTIHAIMPYVNGVNGCTTVGNTPNGAETDATDAMIATTIAEQFANPYGGAYEGVGFTCGDDFGLSSFQTGATNTVNNFRVQIPTTFSNLDPELRESMGANSAAAGYSNGDGFWYRSSRNMLDKTTCHRKRCRARQSQSVRS